MINRIFFFLLLVSISFSAFPQKGEYQSKPFTGLLPKDGKAYLDLMNYDDKSKFMYLIRNDGRNLYIDIMLSDRAAIQRTMMFGFTTWIDPFGKKKKNMGIEFPMAGDGERGMMSRPGQEKERKEMMALAMQEKNSRMMLQGFAGKGSEEVINPMASQGVRGKFERLEGEKVRIALEVPLKMIGSEEPAALSPISVGFETGYLDLNRSGMAAGGGGERRDGGYHGGGPPGGGPPGGGMEQTGGGQQRPDLNELATPSKLWIKKVVLNSGE
jgi:hypothetical protein